MIIYQKRYTRQDLRAFPNDIFVFGDNLVQEGYGGQAAAARGEPNAFGIATKVSPSQFLNDNMFEFMGSYYHKVFRELGQHLHDGATVVWPLDGIGTGLADLKAQAPRVNALLRGYERIIGVRSFS